jgi:serine/threonine protein kinase/tetratricopeptide (TPR) repeat protein
MSEELKERDDTLPLDSQLTPPWPIIEGPGSRVGPYKLLQKLGEGGMGAVFMAEQEAPVRRKVALKIIKPGMDTRQIVARFEVERQALALMDHQNIARVLDAGATESGRPYFVMELVKGVPITQYCDQNRLTPRERLMLFIPICRAIQHAHQKGIIHRDVKPSNVLVTLYDGTPVPKIIDFGVAKATDQRLTERTMFTRFGDVIGTLEYMSPEQAEMSALDIDTRTDIYSLGVLLYELLTGTTPLERARVRQAAYDEILRRIREEEPPKPSTRLSELKEALATISAQRETEPARLTKLMRGELDWIVMKALEKDRTRRYETASGFARDIERYLNDEAVEASPPSVSYWLRKFVRKYRGLIATAAAFAAVLMMGVAISTWQAVAATRARDAARRAFQAEARQRAEAEEQRNRAVRAENLAQANEAKAKVEEAKAQVEEAKAKRSAAESEAVLNFFQDRVLSAARPEGHAGGLGKDVTLRKALDAAEPAIAEAFRDQPTVEASVRQVLGVTYRWLGEPTLAIQEHERALRLRTLKLEPNHPDTLQSQKDLAWAYQTDGQVARAIPLHERTLAALTAKLGPDHPDTLISQDNLASAYRADGQVARAIALHEQTLTVLTAKLGPDHPDTLKCQSNLALAYQIDGQVARAISLHERTLAALTASLGPHDPDALTTQNNLALAHEATGNLGLAIPLFERTLMTRTAKLGPDHPDTLISQDNLAEAYRADGKRDRAIWLLERTLAVQMAKLGSDHPQTLITQKKLGWLYLVRGDRFLSDPLLRVVDDRKTTPGAEQHPAEAAALVMLGLRLLNEKKWTVAESILGECLKLRQGSSPDHWSTFNTQSLLGGSLLGQRKYAEAEPLLLSGYEGIKARQSKIPPPSKVYLTQAKDRVVELYDAWGQPEKAAEWRAKLHSPTADTKPKP